MKFYSNEDLLDKYSRDRSAYKIKPKFVVFPKSENDLLEIIRFARNKKLSINARGGGTGLSGACVGNGIIVDFSKYFNKIIKIGSGTRVQSGILLKKLRPIIEKKGYMLPSVPLHGDCAIGGNVNTRSIGQRTIKYGTIDNQVKFIRGIMPDGRILDTSKKIPKDIEEKIINLKKQILKDKNLIRYIEKRHMVAGGYNLKAFLKYKKINELITHLIVGSTGTLILLTEVELKLPKYKLMKELYLLHFENINLLQKTLNKLIKLKPATLEYAGKQVLELWDKKYQHKNAIAAVILGFESKKNIKNLLKDVLNYRKIPVKEYPKLWNSRALALPKLEEEAKKLGLHLPSGIDDTTFLPKYFSRVMKEINDYGKKEGITIASFGHIGIGSIHLRAFLNKKRSRRTLDKISKNIFKIIRKYNGTLVGEHNSGLGKSRYLKMESKKMYDYMWKVKKVFDHKNILNPKAIFNLDPMTKNLKPYL